MTSERRENLRRFENNEMTPLERARYILNELEPINHQGFQFRNILRLLIKEIEDKGELVK